MTHHYLPNCKLNHVLSYISQAFRKGFTAFSLKYEIGFDQLRENMFDVLISKKMMNVTDAFMKFQIIFNQDMNGVITQDSDKSIKELLLKKGTPYF